MKPDIWTTFDLCREAGACPGGYRKLADSLGGVKEYGARKKISLLQVLKSNDLDDTLWALDHAAGGKDAHRIKHLFMADCAIRVLPIFERERPGDMRPREAIKSTRRYAVGRETTANWDAAGDAAWAAAEPERAWQEARLREYLTGDVKPLRMPRKVK